MHTRVLLLNQICEEVHQAVREADCALACLEDALAVLAAGRPALQIENVVFDGVTLRIVILVKALLESYHSIGCKVNNNSTVVDWVYPLEEVFALLIVI